MANSLQVFKELKKNILSFPIWSLLSIFIVAFIAHGSMIFSNVIGIDTEAAILGIEAYDGQGRQGILWIRNLLGMTKFNLWLTNSLTFFLLIFVPLFFFAAIMIQKKELKNLLFPFCIIFIVSPYWACQLYFLSQSVPVLISLLLIPLIDILIRLSINSKVPEKICLLLLSSALFQLVVSTYQLNMIIYVTYVCCTFAIASLHEKESFKKQIIFLATQAVFVIAGFVIYEVITALFYSQYSSYLTEQIIWAQVGIKMGILNILRVIKAVLKGSELYSFLYVPLCLITFALTVINCFKTREKISQYLLPVLCELFVFASPFFFVLLFGSEVSPRMRYIFPITEALVLLLCYSEFIFFFDKCRSIKQVTIFKSVLIIASCILLFIDSMKGLNYTTRLYYTNEYRFDQEKLIAKDLKKDLNQFFIDNNLPEDERNQVVFLGDVNITYNDMCLPGYATIGSSSINWDSNRILRGRIYKFLKTCGYPIGDAPYFSDGATIAFRYYFDEYFGAKVDAMPAYPYDGYISEVRDDELGLYYYIVKLGNNWRKPELLPPE